MFNNFENKYLKFSFFKCKNILEKNLPKFHLYLLTLSFNQYIYLCSCYSFFYILYDLKNTKNTLKKYDIKIMKLLKEDIYNIENIFKNYNYFINNDLPIEFMSFSYIYYILKFDLIYIDNLLESIFMNFDIYIYNNINQLKSYINGIGNFFSYILFKIIHKLDYNDKINNVGNAIFLTYLILNIKKYFLLNTTRIYIPYKKNDINFLFIFIGIKINKKYIRDFDMKLYLDFILNKRGNLFRLQNEPIFNSIINNIIILNYQYYSYKTLINNNIITLFINLYMDLLSIIVKEPHYILYNNLNISYLKLYYNLGLLNLGKIYFNYYYYKIKFYF